MNDNWYVYMVRCSDQTIYTGITTDLEKRIKAHNSENGGARYTKSRRPVTLVYARRTGSQSDAAKLEYQIKKMPRKSKILLIEEKKYFLGAILSEESPSMGMEYFTISD